MSRILTLVTGLALVYPALADEPGKELAGPVRIKAAGKAIDIGGVGHSAPFAGDIDGDGIRDLLVGTFSDGVLRIYRNQGSNRAPKFDQFTLLHDGKPEGKVPTG